MNLRTYRARTMGDCLAEVKKDLGKDAVILHTRTFKVGGVLGFGGTAMVEVTASDGEGTLPKRRSANIAALKAYSAPAGPDSGAFKPVVDRAARNAAAKNEGSVALAAAPDETAAEPDPPVVVTVPQRLPVVRTGASAGPPAPVAGEPSTTLPAPPPHVDHGFSSEIATLKRMIGQVLHCSRHTAVQLAREAGTGISLGSLPATLMHYYVKMLDNDLSAELADEVIAGVREDVPANRLDEDAVVRPAVLRAITNLLPTDDSSPASTDGRPLTLALVGPTGVGKTTTIAKLAANFKLRRGKRVGLVTSDTYRIAAVDQLRTYAEIIGLPLKVAMSPSDMAACCESLADCDVVLVDTAGRSPRDAGRLDELRQFIEAARPHQAHLVLSSVSSQAVMIEAANRFLPIRPDRVVFTKIDEAVTHGAILTVARRIELPVSFITTGQEVPDHIEPARSERLAALLLDSPGGVR